MLGGARLPMLGDVSYQDYGCGSSWTMSLHVADGAYRPTQGCYDLNQRF